jgi:hypothetical protein
MVVPLAVCEDSPVLIYLLGLAREACKKGLPRLSQSEDQTLKQIDTLRDDRKFDADSAVFMR